MLVGCGGFATPTLFVLVIVPCGINGNCKYNIVNVCGCYTGLIVKAKSQGPLGHGCVLSWDLGCSDSPAIVVGDAGR